MKKTAIVTALLLASGAASATAINSLTFTSGTFSMGGPNDNITPAAFANMPVDGSYAGAVPSMVGSAAFYATTSIGTFAFGNFGPVAVYTAENDGLNFGFPGVTGDITGNALSLDLSSWTAYWNGTSFNQGSSGSIFATTFDAGTGVYTADWSALIIGGPFNNATGTWHIEGVATAPAVPVPAAVWLFGSGLLGLVGVARRHKTA